jgi:hypothetical protein
MFFTWIGYMAGQLLDGIASGFIAAALAPFAAAQAMKSRFRRF